MEPYPSGQFGFSDDPDRQFGNGWVWTRTRTRSDGPEPFVTLCIPSHLAKPFSLPEAPRNLQKLEADQLHLTLGSSPYPSSRRAETRLVLSNSFDRRCHPHYRRRSKLQRRWESYPRIPHLREPIVQTLPMYPAQRSFGDYLRPAASMHLEVTSEGQRIVVTSPLASEDPEVNFHPMAPPFDGRNIHLQLAARFQIASWWVSVP